MRKCDRCESCGGYQKADEKVFGNGKNRGRVKKNRGRANRGQQRGCNFTDAASQVQMRLHPINMHIPMGLL